MSVTSHQKVRLGVAAGLSGAALLLLAACGEPATEGEQQQGSVVPQSEQSMATTEDGEAAPQANTQ